VSGSRIQPLSIALFIADLVLVTLGLVVASELRSALPYGQGGALPESATAIPWPIYLLALVAWGTGLLSSGTYEPQRVLRWFNEAWRVIWGAALASGLMAGVLYLSYRELSRLQFVYFFIATVGMLLGYRAALRVFFKLVGRTRGGSQSRILILGAGDLGRQVAKMLRDHGRWGFDAVGFLDDDSDKLETRILGLPVLGSIDQLSRLARETEIDEVWIALPVRAHERLQDVLEVLERHPVRVKVVPDYFSMALVRANAEVLGGMPIIGLRDPLIEGFPRLIKRLFDIVITAVLLLPALILMGLIALLIRLDSKGSAVLQQERVGENGRPFGMYKFRTMLADAKESPRKLDLVMHKRPNDPRVTRIGRMLRRFSLDELPQLFNVLKGEMSLVGPRPEMPWLVDRYDSWQRKRFAVPQGLTGWWQINGRSDKPMHMHTEDDLYYVYNYSLWLDIKILLRTPMAVLAGKGAF
jgi:exopolysaccharide biosynthesis polyprenyl glycosylphosphotransferase